MEENVLWPEEPSHLIGGLNRDIRAPWKVCLEETQTGSKGEYDATICIVYMLLISKLTGALLQTEPHSGWIKD